MNCELSVNKLPTVWDHFQDRLSAATNERKPNLQYLFPAFTHHYHRYNIVVFEFNGNHQSKYPSISIQSSHQLHILAVLSLSHTHSFTLSPMHIYPVDSCAPYAIRWLTILEQFCFNSIVFTVLVHHIVHGIGLMSVLTVCFIGLTELTFTGTQELMNK